MLRPTQYARDDSGPTKLPSSKLEKKHFGIFEC